MRCPYDREGRQCWGPGHAGPHCRACRAGLPYNVDAPVPTYGRSPACDTLERIKSGDLLEVLDAYVGIDPGATGAMCLLDATGSLVVEDWAGTSAAYARLRMWDEVYNIRLVVFEKQEVKTMHGKRSATTYQQHAGRWKAILELLEVNWIEVRPQEWMKHRITVKLNKTDKPSMRYVAAKYPQVELFGPRGGKQDGRSDAICIAEFAREQSKKGKH